VQKFIEDCHTTLERLGLEISERFGVIVPKDTPRNYKEMERTVNAAEKLSRNDDEREAIYFMRGAMFEKMKRFDKAEAEFRRLRHRPFLARVCHNHGIFLTALGRLAEAQDAFDEAARLHLENGDRQYAAHTFIDCAEILIDQGRLVEARDYLARARDLLDTLPEQPHWVLRDYESQQARLQAAIGAQTFT
jgi:tetratricopeptide (TPR) repeat protein